MYMIVMVTIVNELIVIAEIKNKCYFESCQKNGFFNIANKYYCSKHNPLGNCPLSQKCSNKDCIIRGSFKFEGEKYCKKHRPDNSISQSKIKQHNHRIDKFDMLLISANYFKFEGKKYCKKHISITDPDLTETDIE
jgi:hypothetical protein